MEYELRKPQATDLFVVCKIIRGIGLKNITDCISNNQEVKELRTKISEENKQVNEDGTVIQKEYTDEQLGQASLLVMTLLGDLLLEKMEFIQNDLIKFMSNLSGLEPKEIETLSLVDFAEMVVAIIKEPDFVDFIKVVLKSFK